MSILGSVLPWLQIVLAVALCTTVLLQPSEAGLGSSFGSAVGGGFYRKRGFEKQLFIATIIIAVLFCLSTLLALFVK